MVNYVRDEFSAPDHIRRIFVAAIFEMYYEKVQRSTSAWRVSCTEKVASRHVRMDWRSCTFNRQELPPAKKRADSNLDLSMTQKHGSVEGTEGSSN